ncbi:hypothetical protein [Pseudonocardia sp. TMWB2A]|uniref:hypothetical protein n=1 Tax=Pseudonocardia sp. TMWB2A TaxID=687430 RepID=UPI00307F7D24
MREQLDHRIPAEHHDIFWASIDTFFGKIMEAFKALTRINYNAPWTAQKPLGPSSRVQCG